MTRVSGIVERVRSSRHECVARVSSGVVVVTIVRGTKQVSVADIVAERESQDVFRIRKDIECDKSHSGITGPKLNSCN